MVSKLEVMIEGMTNKAMTDAKAFAKVIQLAEKFQVFKAQTPNHSALVASAIEKLERGLVALGIPRPTLPPNDTPTQSNPNMK
jgi:hypothetical protein